MYNIDNQDRRSLTLQRHLAFQQLQENLQRTISFAR